jgi:hypothetical protein
MAFDVYVGTMTRFYRGEWENVAQRFAREQGFRHTTIHAAGEPQPPPPADEIHSAVSAWCSALSEGLKEHGVAAVEWDESDERPFFTDRPGWDGYTALLCWAAHAEHPDDPVPSEVPRLVADDPAYQRSTAEGFKSKYAQILLPEIWLPVDFTFTFEGPSLVAEKSHIGSTFGLKRQLDELHLRTLERVPQPTPQIAAVQRTWRAPQKSGFLRRLFGRRRRAPRPEPDRASLAEAAAVGLEIFRDLVGKACEHRLPILGGIARVDGEHPSRYSK